MDSRKGAVLPGWGLPETLVVVLAEKSVQPIEQGSMPPISPVSATAEGGNATIAGCVHALWQRQHEEFAFLAALSFARAGGNAPSRVHLLRGD